MSLHYIIDGYNLVRHRVFEGVHKGADKPRALVHCIRERHLCGSRKNKITIVFDGFPAAGSAHIEDPALEILFSREESADERIKRLVESAAHPKTVLVVSDDNEVRFFARSAGTQVLKVAEFAAVAHKRAAGSAGKDAGKAEISQSSMLAINRELRSLWLK